jgi:hypothetical protein
MEKAMTRMVMISHGMCFRIAEPSSGKICNGREEINVTICAPVRSDCIVTAIVAVSPLDNIVSTLLMVYLVSLYNYIR